MPRGRKSPVDICKIECVKTCTWPAWSVSSVGFLEGIFLSHPPAPCGTTDVHLRDDGMGYPVDEEWGKKSVGAQQIKTVL